MFQIPKVAQNTMVSNARHKFTAQRNSSVRPHPPFTHLPLVRNRVALKRILRNKSSFQV
jgi:hypothetical protein